MTIYPHESDSYFKQLVQEFKRVNKREPNDLDKVILTDLWKTGWNRKTLLPVR